MAVRRVLLVTGLAIVLTLIAALPVLAQPVEPPNDPPLATIPVGPHPTGLVVNPFTHRVYVGDMDQASVRVIDGLQNLVIATIAAGQGPFYHMAVDVKTNRVYVPLVDTGAIAVIDGTQNEVIALVPISGGAPEGVAVLPGRNLIYVTHSADLLSVIDGETLREKAVYRTRKYNHSTAINPTTGRAYVSRTDPSRTTVIDLKTGLIVTELGVGGFSTVNPNTNRIYIANFYEPFLSVVDGATDTIIATVARDSAAQANMAIDRTTNCLYIPNGDLGTVTVFDADTNTRLGALSTGLASSHHAVAAVDTSTHLVYVTGPNAGAVAVVHDPLCADPPPAWTLYLPIVGWVAQPAK